MAAPKVSSEARIGNVLACVNILFGYSLTRAVNFPLFIDMSPSLQFDYLLFILFCYH